MAVAGPAADTLGVQGWYLLTGVIMLVMAVGAFFIPALTRLEERET
jgi:hypothetical protein